MQKWLIVVVVACGVAVAQAEEKRPPNVVLIFTDDQGYEDVGCFGSPNIATPNLDRMAKEGMKLTDFYVGAPICSASRASLLTGCYCQRVSVTGVYFPRHKVGLNPKEITIAEMLKDKGYATACIGKWHLGHLKPFLPTSQGFDSYFDIPYSNDMRIKRGNKSGPPLMRNEEIIEHPANQATLTQRYTEEAVQFIRKSRAKPFFLYLPHTMPHVPLFASKNFKGKSKRGLYGDVIEEIDWSVGEILKTLRDLKLDEQTLVIFTSDNGPWLSKKKNGGSAKPLRDGKFSTFEGGMRVPCIVRWPGKIPAGKTCAEVAATIDVLPTVAALTGAKMPKDRILDGKDVSSLLLGKKGAKSPHKAYYFYRGNNLQAVRSGKWKLHLRRKGKGKNAIVTDWLFDLATDVGEQKNVAEKNPEVVTQLKKMAQSFDAELKKNRRPQGKIEATKP